MFHGKNLETSVSKPARQKLTYIIYKTVRIALYRHIFAQFMTMREKQILASQGLLKSKIKFGGNH